MDPSSQESLVTRIADLLLETGEAHGMYEAEVLGGALDPNWPQWYAPYLRQHGLTQLLRDLDGRDQVIDDLEGNLMRADKAFKSTTGDKGGNWPDFYAVYLIQRASE